LFDWSNRSANTREVVESVAWKVRAAVGSIDGRRFLGALGTSEADLDEILDWLKQNGWSRRRAAFRDDAISAIDRAVFFTWLASEWAYFSWRADDRNFWPCFTTDIFGEQPALLSFNDIYQQLRLVFRDLKLENHLGDSEAAWCYVESLRRQSGFPRAWWDCVHRIVQDHKHQRDVQGNWARLLQEECDWPRSFSHAARRFPEEVNAFFDAADEAVDTRSAEPLRRFNHAFAREPDTLADYLTGDKQFRTYVEILRARRVQRRDARVQRSSRRFWIDSVELGIAALERGGRWSVSFAAFLPDMIPREVLPAQIAGSTAITLSSQTAEREVRYDPVDNGFRASARPPFLLLRQMDDDTRLTVRGALSNGTRPTLEVAGLRALDESPAFYRVSPRDPNFYVPVATLPDDRTIEVPQGRHVLLVVPRGVEEVVCDPDPLALIDLGRAWTVRVLAPPDPACDVLVGEGLWRLSAKLASPGEFSLDGPRLDEAIGDRIFTSWPSLRWLGSGAAQLRDIRVAPDPQASNARFVRRLVGNGVVIEHGSQIALGDLAFAVAGGPAGRLPREFIGRAVLEVEIEEGSQRWHLRYSFKLIPQTEICPSRIETDDTWELPLQVVVRGVETLRLTTSWELAAGGVAEQETWETESQGGELLIDTRIPVRGSRLICQLSYGFRRELPPDLEPAFAIKLECPLSGALGFLLDASAQPKVVRPLGAKTALRVEELVMHSLVLVDSGSTDSAGFCLALGNTRRTISGGEMSLAHVRQEVQALCRRHGRLTSFLETPGEPRRPLFTIVADAAIDVEEPSPRPRLSLRDLAVSEPDDVDLRSAAQAVVESLVGPPDEHLPREKWWSAIARLRLRDFAGWEPSQELLNAYQELSRSRTHVALPWLWKSWGLKRDQAAKDLDQYPLMMHFVDRLERLGCLQGFSFLPALLIGAQDLGPETVPELERERMRYLIAMLCTGCRSSMAYRARSMNSVPRGPRSPDRQDVRAPAWVSKPEDLRYPLAWELFRVNPHERDLRTLKVCRQVKIDDPRSECEEDIGEGSPDLTCGVINLEQRLAMQKHNAWWVVRAALACSQEWARYVVYGGDFTSFAPLVDAFHLVCRLTPTLTRALCIDAVLHEMDRHEVGWAAWDACRNDGQSDLDAFPELWKHLKVSQVN
jgi:hypothetical protein